MVVIRLVRGGSKHAPKYRVAVADQRRAAGGRYIDTVGFYDPMASDKRAGLSLNVEKIEHWMKTGAQPTPTVRSLLKKAQSSS